MLIILQNSLGYITLYSLSLSTRFHALPFLFFYFFFKFSSIHSTEIETAREKGNTGRGSGRGRSRFLEEEADVGLDPTTL